MPSDSDEGIETVPKVEDFGYHFKDDRLVAIKDGSKFKFTTQKNYEDLGDAIALEVYEMMEREGLRRRRLGCDVLQRFVFASPGYKKKERILVLIHGSGVVKAGQWARKLIINESLTRGTQLPYIRRGLQLGWGVVVLNYNERCMPGSKHACNPSSHASLEWEALFPPSLRSELIVVAHSFGGYVISSCLKDHEPSFRGRVSVVCLTDAGFTGAFPRVANWHTRRERLKKAAGVYALYSGDSTHEGTSSAAINSIFHVLENVRKDTDQESWLRLLEEAQGIVIAEMKEKRTQANKEAAQSGPSSTEEEKKQEVEPKDEEKSDEKKEDEETAVEEEKKDVEMKIEEKKEDEGKEGDEGKEKNEVKQDDDTQIKDQKDPTDGEEDEKMETTSL